MSIRPTDAAVRAQAIVEALGGRWNGHAGSCRCPAHGDQTPSLSVRLGERAILFHCFAGCKTEDILAELRRRRLHDHAVLAVTAPRPSRDLSAMARRLWRESSPLAGSPAAAYLAARGVADTSGKLRYHPRVVYGSGARRQVLPAMVAAVETDLGLIAVQRTFLDLDELLRKPLAKPKAALGQLGSGAIRLAEPSEELGLAEGVEDALSAMHWFGTPTWALAGVERLGLVAIPPTVRRIIVYGDHGVAAERCYATALDHLTTTGREVVRRLAPHGEDWNDAWRRHRSASALHTTISA